MKKYTKITAMFFLCILLLLGTVFACAASEEHSWGDADGNGKINLLDVGEMLKSVAKWNNAKADPIYSDINQNGRVDLTDASIVMKEIAWYDAKMEVIPGVGVETVSYGEAYCLVDGLQNVSYSNSKEGIASGWRYDNRGGIPRTEIDGGYNILTDISEEAGVALIRDFNRVDSGRIVIETTLTVSGDGFAIELVNDAGEAVYSLYTDSGWRIRGEDKEISGFTVSNGRFSFRIVVDLDRCVAETVINNTSCGTSALLTCDEDANVMSFRYATGEKSLATATLGDIRICVNYRINDNFNFYPDGALSGGWTGEGANIKGGSVSVSNGYVIKTFEPVQGTVCADADFLAENGQRFSFSLGSGDTPVISFSYDGEGFCVDGERVYEPYSVKMWNSVRIEADTVGMSAKVWFNGRVISTVRLRYYTNHLNSLIISTEDSGVRIESPRVWEKVTHSDYVPVPISPEGDEDYTVGINACSLWREGTHWGWSTITPYESEPVLGYYDEGSPEVADWEIKYMVEHGIDFQAYCWYAGTGRGAMFSGDLSTHMQDGYMFAEYSDMVKYCLLWEVQNGGMPDDLEAWKDSFVPYFIEHYFKDSRYMTIDNCPLIFVFGGVRMAETLGVDTVNEMFAYLDEEVKKLGFDGMIYIISGNAEAIWYNMGFDGCYAYNWGVGGNNYQYTKDSIMSSYNSGYIYTVPTVSVGFNDVAWSGERHPMMNFASYELIHKWVRDEYLPDCAEEDSWQENFVMLSTWNEYGEGTYIMPTTSAGFGYLDVIRDVYTKEGKDESVNIVPTDAQRERINHLYPQYRRLLRREVNLINDSGITDSMVINGLDVKMQLFAENAGEGHIAVPFDPKIALDYRLNAFHTWDYDTKILTLEFIGHTIVYTVGNNICIVDGTETELGFEVYLKDGLPMIDLEHLCSVVGYTYKFDGTSIIIDTAQRSFFDKLALAENGSWEFDTDGYAEGWTSNHMSLVVKDGTVRASSVVDTNDPIISYKGGKVLNAGDYVRLEVRCRYKYDSPYPMAISMYFATRSNSSMDEAKSFKLQLDSSDSGDEWETYSVDVDTNKHWTGDIIALRFDPFNAKGEMEIDYIRFVPAE